MAGDEQDRHDDGGSARDEELIGHLRSLEVSEDEARRAVDEGRAGLLLAHRALGGVHSYTPDEVAERTGVPTDVLRARDRALGLPDTTTYTDTDVEDAEALARLLGAIDTGDLLQTAREDAALIRRLAMTHLQLIRDQILTPMREDGEDQVGIALALQDLAGPLLGSASALLATSYRRLLTHLLSTDMVVQGATTTDRPERAVGFVDVIGYTSLSARVDPAGLRDILERFEGRCTDVAAESPDVELVKFLGDAAMYVSADPETLASLLLELVDPVPHDDEDDLELSGGMAFGPVLTRGGDVFGTPVNLAARLTDLAVGGSLVADDELSDRFAERFAISRLPPRKLHGIGRRRPIRLRRAS